MKNDNTLFLVKGNNPLTVYHFPALGLYVYASTKSILDNALKKVKLNDKCCEVDVSEGEILEINSAGNLSRSTFTMQDYIHTMFNPYNWDYAKWWMEDEREELLLEYCAHSAFRKKKSSSCLILATHRTRSKNCLWIQRQWRKQLTRQKHCCSVKHKSKRKIGGI